MAHKNVMVLPTMIWKVMVILTSLAMMALAMLMVLQTV